MVRKEAWLDDSNLQDGVVDVAITALQHRFTVVEHFLPLAAEHADKDIEHVHQTRVWARRADAALKMFKEFIPGRKFDWLHKQLKRIRRAANDARDCDVFAKRLATERKKPEVARLLRKVHAHRREAQQPIIAICKRLHDRNRLQNHITQTLQDLRKKKKKKSRRSEEKFALLAGRRNNYGRSLTTFVTRDKPT